MRVHDSNPLNLQTVHSRISEQLQELREKELLPHHYHLQVCSGQAAFYKQHSARLPTLQGSVIVEQFLSNAMSDADVVIEAVVDSMEAKISIFKGLRNTISIS